jgi:hypothetical protein
LDALRSPACIPSFARLKPLVIGQDLEETKLGLSNCRKFSFAVFKRAAAGIDNESDQVP